MCSSLSRSLRLLSTSQMSEPSVSSSSSSGPSWSGRGRFSSITRCSPSFLWVSDRDQNIPLARFLAIRDAIPACNNDDFLKEAAEVPNFLEEVDQCKRSCSAGGAVTPSGEFFSSGRSNVSSVSQRSTRLLCVCFNAADREKSHLPEVVFLGTGSALPMKIRNVSGTLVHIRYTI